MGAEIGDTDVQPSEQKGTTYRIFRLLAWVNGLAAVGLALMLALPSFIDWSDYKEKIAKIGATSYGLEIKIEGAVYAQFLPSPVFKLNRVTLTKPGEPGAHPLFIKRADVEMAFLPLLRGKLEPRAVLLHKPDFILGVTEDKKLSIPIGLREIFLGRKSGTISRFGVQEAGFYQQGAAEDQLPLLRDINFLGKKSAGTENWSLQGYFSRADKRHNFQIVTRGRPDKSITFIDAQFKNTGETVLTHSFNGSVSERGGDFELEGQYQTGGRLDHAGFLYALNTKAKIKLSQSQFNISGFTLSASPVSSAEKSRAKKSLRINLEVKAHRNASSDRWQVDSELYAQSVDDQLLTTALRDDVGTFDALDKLHTLAQFIDGRLSVRAKDVQISAHEFPSVYANIIFDRNVMHIVDAGAKLPAGGRLQAERFSAVEATNEQNKELTYKGAVYVKTDTLRDIAALLPADQEKSALGSLSPGRNQFSMSGMLQVSKSALSFSSDNLLLNDAKGKVALILRQGRDLRRDLFLNLEKVSLERVLHTTDKSLLDLVAAAAHPDKPAPDAAEAPSATKFDISINTLLWRGTALRNIKTRGRFSSDEVSVQDFSIGGTGDQNFTLMMRGHAKDLTNHPQGRFDVSLKSPKTLDALSLIAPKFVLSEKGKTFIQEAGVADPLIVKASFFSAPENGKKWSLKLDGQLASTEFSSEGQFEPNLSRNGYMAKAVDVRLELSNPSSRILAAQILRVPLANLKAIPETEGYMRASVTGSDEGGFDIALGGEVSDLQLTLGGTAKRLDGHASLAAQVKLYSPKSLALTRFAGLSASSDSGVTEYVANIAGSGSQYVISGGHGKIAGKTIGLDANIDFSLEKPKLSARATAKQIGPDGLKTAFAIFSAQGNAVKEFAAHIETQIILQTPLIRFAQGVDLTHAQAQITLGEKETALDALSGDFYGGKLQVKGGLQIGEAGVKLAAQYELKDAELSRVLVQESQEKIAKGQFTLAGELGAQSADLRDISKKISGRGYIKAGEGELRGLNPAAFGRAVRFVSNGTELNGMIGGILSEGAIPFSRFQSAYTIKDGIISTEKTQLISREVRARNNTSIDLNKANIKSDWTFTLNRLPNTPALKLQFAGRPHQLKRRIESTRLRKYLMALMRKGEDLSTRFAAQRPAARGADDIQTGSVKRRLMKKPLQLEDLKIVPKANPLRGPK